MSPLALRWLGCAGFRITAGDAALLIDPWVSRNPRARPPVSATLAELLPADAVILSHGHFDHAADVPALCRLAPVPVHATARGIRSLAREGVPAALLREIEPSWRGQIGPFAIQADPVHHVRYGAKLIVQTVVRLGWRGPSYLPLLTQWPCGQAVSLRIEVGGVRMVHMGTAGATARELDAIAARGPVDVLLVALQGNARIHEIAARIVERLKPRVVIPHHQDDFYPPVSMEVPVAPFTELVKQTSPRTLVRELAVGETLELAAAVAAA